MRTRTINLRVSFSNANHKQQPHNSYVDTGRVTEKLAHMLDRSSSIELDRENRWRLFHRCRTSASAFISGNMQIARLLKECNISVKWRRVRTRYKVFFSFVLCEKPKEGRERGKGNISFIYYFSFTHISLLSYILVKGM